MALGALSVGLLLLFHHATGSTYFHFRGSENVTTLQCNTTTGAGNVGILCSIWNFNTGAEIEKIQCEKEVGKLQDCENINPKKKKEKLQCQRCRRNEDEMNSLTFTVKTVDSVIFTCTVQNSTESSECPNWIALTREGCEIHNLFFVINLNDSDEVFSTVETSSLLTVSEGENVTLPCQFENRKHLPFTLFWIISGNINKCLHSVHIEDYSLYYNTRCCVDKESSQRISNQSSENPTNEILQSHNLTIHSVKELDTGSYLCVVHGQALGKPAWKITANISLSVTKRAENPDTHSPTSGISPVTNSGTPANNEDQVTRSSISSIESPDTVTSTSGISPVTNDSNHKIIPVSIGIVCVLMLICIVGVICIVKKKRQMAKGLPYSVFPSREQRDENEHVAYAVTTVPTTMSQPRSGEGQGSHSTSASAEHVYCLIKESTVKGNGDKAETQEGKCKDHLNHGSQVENSSAIESKDHTLLKEEDPIASSNDQTYSLVSYPGTESLGNTVTQPCLEENDPKHCPLEMEENPIYSKMEDN